MDILRMLINILCTAIRKDCAGIPSWFGKSAPTALDKSLVSVEEIMMVP